MLKVNVKRGAAVPALLILAATVMAVCVEALATAPGRRQENTVHPIFDLARPDGGPFPSDRFTVADPKQNTGRRLALPMPSDCVANASECDDVTVINQLDGFHTTPRVSIPFDGEINVSTATSDNIFLVSLGDSLAALGDEASGDSGEVIPTGSPDRLVGINQMVWDAATRTLHFTSDESLDEHSRYAVVVTRGVRDTAGDPIEPSPEFRRYRHDLARSDDPVLRWYRRALLTAERAARRTGVQRRDIAAVSVFSTQSATYLVEKVRDQVRGGATPAVADFNVGPDGSRAVYAFSGVTGITFNRQTSVSGPLSPEPQPNALAAINLASGALGTVAFGRLQSPDFMVHPGEYIPVMPSRTGVAAVQGVNTLYFTLTLPAGPAPAGGWPVALYGHGSERNKNQIFESASLLAARGIAVIAVSMVGHGFGPASSITLTRTDGTTVTALAGGRGIDQDGNGTIDAREGDQALAPRRLLHNSDAQVQNVADLMQLARLVQAGVDVDGDGACDLDPGRMYYYGHSLGGMYGIAFFAYTPEARAGVFLVPGAPLLENRRLSPSQRHQLGQFLAARTPSLLNSANGLTSIGGVPAQAPFFNENLPQRDQPPIVNTVPGAIAIQQFLDRAYWAMHRGSPLAAVARLRRAPPPGIAPRPFVLAFARGDTASPNPNTTAMIRAGAFADRAVYYRHDLYWAANPTIPKNPHGFPLQLVPPSPAYAQIVRASQAMIGEFFASDGATVSVTGPTAPFWEVPIASPLPEDLGYIP